MNNLCDFIVELCKLYRMNRVTYTYLLLFFSAFLVLSGCKKDETYTYPAAEGTLKVNFYPKVRGQNFVLNHTYYDLLSYQYNMSTFKFYVSNLTLIKDDGSTLVVDTVSLLDYEGLNPGDPATISIKVPAGSYKGAKFWIGIDSVRNNQGPIASAAQTDPLSVYQGTYWTWNTGFRFIMLEGESDSVANDTTNTGGFGSFTYHVGTNSMYTPVVLPEQTLLVDSAQTTAYNLNVDVNKLYYSATDTIIKYKEPITHTTDNAPLATRVIHNLSQAFSPQ